MPSGLIAIPAQIRQAIEAHVENCYPEECCGLLALDESGRIRFVYPLTNVNHSAVSFTVSPEESYRAFLHAEERGWAVAGEFHSHPNGPDYPSNRDIEAAIEGWVHLLVSPAGLSAWRIENGLVVSLPESGS